MYEKNGQCLKTLALDDNFLEFSEKVTRTSYKEVNATKAV